MSERAFQEHYCDEVAVCYGCGTHNEHGLQIKSYWDGDTSVCRYTPKPFHTAMEGFVYGGLLASLVDCHGTGTAAAAAYRAAGRDMGEGEPLRFVTASLKVDYLHPTPLGPQLELRGTVREIKGRKVVVAIDVIAEGRTCARGEVVAVQMPQELWEKVRRSPA